MSNISNIEKWQINLTEKGIYCNTPYGPSNNNTLQLYVPLVMPLIKGPVAPNQVVTSLQSSCFINSSDCMPAVNRTISTQNYLTFQKNSNYNFMNSYLRFGSTVLVEFRNYNIDNRFIDISVDESFNID